jgi:hypothetical protein
MAVATPSFGANLQIGDGGGPETFTTIGEVMDITGPTTSVELEDTTTHSSGIPWRTKVATLLDGGEVSFDINYDSTDATHGDGTTGLEEDLIARQVRNFRLITTDTGAAQLDFAAYITQFERQEPVAGLNRVSVTLSITGQWVKS